MILALISRDITGGVPVVLKETNLITSPESTLLGVNLIFKETLSKGSRVESFKTPTVQPHELEISVIFNLFELLFLI